MEIIDKTVKNNWVIFNELNIGEVFTVESKNPTIIYMKIPNSKKIDERSNTPIAYNAICLNNGKNAMVGENSKVFLLEVELLIKKYLINN